MNPDTLIHLCRECAGRIYGTRPPSARYAESVARLLAGTAAAESLLKWRRQQPPSIFRWTSLKGAWGLWQTEHLAVGDSVKYLRRRTDVQASAVRFAPRMAEAMLLETLPLMQLIHDDDAVAVTFARLHYLRVAEAVPDDLRGQAAYYKKYYNTVAGKGSVEKYLRDWRRLVEPAL